MTTTYETDIIAWANEQAAFIRAGKFDLLDIEHIAEEIEDVGKSEKRELASRMAVLLMHLLKWQYQPDRRSKSWERTIKEQRRQIHRELKATPSLTPSLQDPEWRDRMWSDAVSAAIGETGLAHFPESCHWDFASVLTDDWLPPEDKGL